MSDPSTDALHFATGLLNRGIEFTLRRNGRLHVWPGRAYKHLSDAERAFIEAHKAELIQIALAKTLPETTVTFSAAIHASPRSATPPASVPACPYCRRRPCVGTAHPAYPTLHFTDPAEVARRDAEATKVMYHQVGKRHDYI